MAPEPLPPALDECVWEVVSYAWTEIGIDQAECDRLVRRFGLGPANVDAARRICFRDAAASFGFETFLVFPLFLWMLMPDWGYGETYLRRRILNWRKRPLIWHFANPLRVLAYPLALLLALPQWRMLRKSLLANITPKDGQNGAT